MNTKYDRHRAYCVISAKQKKIYATRLTELQATKLVEELRTDVSDVSVLDNRDNVLVSKKYDKYTDV